MSRNLDASLEKAIADLSRSIRYGSTNRTYEQIAEEVRVFASALLSAATSASAPRAELVVETTGIEEVLEEMRLFISDATKPSVETVASWVRDLDDLCCTQPPISDEDVRKAAEVMAWSEIAFREGERSGDARSLRRAEIIRGYCLGYRAGEKGMASK